jgi:glycosyltransferase involved in cell wall biosynthesis
MGAAVAARTAALRALARRAARSATACVFVSEHLRQRAGIEGAVVSPPLDPLYFGPPAPHAQFERLRPYVLTVGDIYAYKNLTVLVDALAELPNAELRLVIAGRRVQETEAARIERRADELGVRERIVMLGAVPHDSMPALYSGAACFAFASLLESFGFPPLEAMACGVPVAAARASAMPSILGDAPEWFAPHDPDDAAGALARLLAEPGPAVERGRAQARLYDPAAAGAALADVWRRAAAYHRLP